VFQLRLMAFSAGGPSFAHVVRVVMTPSKSLSVVKALQGLSNGASERWRGRGAV
jgi:hypothetical protein